MNLNRLSEVAPKIKCYWLFVEGVSPTNFCRGTALLMKLTRKSITRILGFIASFSRLTKSWVRFRSECTNFIFIVTTFILHHVLSIDSVVNAPILLYRNMKNSMSFCMTYYMEWLGSNAWDSVVFIYYSNIKILICILFMWLLWNITNLFDYCNQVGWSSIGEASLFLLIFRQLVLVCNSMYKK